jgi:hypothetical protein
VPALGDGITSQKSRDLFSFVLLESIDKSSLTLAEKAEQKRVHFPASGLETFTRVLHQITPSLFQNICAMLVASP